MSTLEGPHDWSLNRNPDGHRDYKLTWLVKASNSPPSSIEDPSVIINTAGIPITGSTWSDLTFITGSDPWAFCLPEVEVTPQFVKSGEAPQYYFVTNNFSTRPQRRCQNASIENPLNEPHALSGNWVNKKVKPNEDRDGLPYRSSTGEPLASETDDSDWEIVISFNTPQLDLETVDNLRHTLNDATLWGLPAETVKFGKYSFSRKLYGLCTFYYTNTMYFAVRDSWVQNLADIGRMELAEGGSASVPEDWIVTKDVFGENKPLLRLDVDGKPIVSDSQTPNTIVRNPYNTGNLLLLGIPAVL